MSIWLYDAGQESINAPKGSALGFMGHLHRMCHMIVSLMDDVNGSAEGRNSSLNDMTHADSVMELLEADACWARWVEFSSTVLAPIYERERVPLGGVNVSTAHVRLSSLFDWKYAREQDSNCVTTGGSVLGRQLCAERHAEPAV